jgi:hypothetical protein
MALISLTTSLARSISCLPRIGFRCGRRVGPINQHCDLSPGATQPYRDGQDLSLVVGRARQSHRCNIEERAQPCRAEVYVDPIASDVDAVDQGGQKGALACCGQLGPALADLRGAHDQPALRGSIGKPRRLVDAAGIEKPLAHAAGHKPLDLLSGDAQPGRALALTFGDQRAGEIVAVARALLERVARRHPVAIPSNNMPVSRLGWRVWGPELRSAVFSASCA